MLIVDRGFGYPLPISLEAQQQPLHIFTLKGSPPPLVPGLLPLDSVRIQVFSFFSIFFSLLVRLEPLLPSQIL